MQNSTAKQVNCASNQVQLSKLDAHHREAGSGIGMQWSFYVVLSILWTRDTSIWDTEELEQHHDAWAAHFKNHQQSFEVPRSTEISVRNVQMSLECLLTVS